MGLIGGPLVVWFVIAAFRGRKGLGAERNFWLMLIAFSLLIGLAVVGERDYFGVAHLTLVPLELLGLTLLSARFFSRRLDRVPDRRRLRHRFFPGNLLPRAHPASRKHRRSTPTSPA